MQAWGLDVGLVMKVKLGKLIKITVVSCIKMTVTGVYLIMQTPFRVPIKLKMLPKSCDKISRTVGLVHVKFPLHIRFVDALREINFA